MKEFKTITKNEIEMGFINEELRDYENSINDWSDLDKDELEAIVELFKPSNSSQS